ncbi:MAG: serine hydroxymethyltransferase [Chloroflexi bacterium AL-W]|nr:serine hydroxymethyltransferase [Chloroflexi bacterium AL-N1]NOK70079.1 serine hydroxymethyltransferase [Chloroflexi bacterium AL-N10]NOK77909.1 serine hydroxymethyltransferase [Chloroflexi bacterium AL-N5]NOK84918.1 serine hydroxymethyltransferase [Chloroflexi bacterium AL-W]NOK91897.1 serine hydroxymethyltransferase [Chloroflexi bacterium AL-N15]
MHVFETLQHTDPEIAAAITNEAHRQRDGLELIASENYTSKAVLEAQGSILTNKYAEGLPGKRYYGGCEFVDVVEQLAIDRALKLFGAQAANVQPHSGAQANIAVFTALLQPGDTILGMRLDHGGHLTHGSPVNFSGKWYNVHFYGVDPETGQMNYDEIARVAREVQPKLITSGASAYPRIVDFARLREIADEVGALLLADIAHIAGLVAAGEHPSPVGHAQVVTTTTHKTLRGPRGGLVMCDTMYAKQLNSSVFPGTQGGPLMHVIAGKAVAFAEALQPSFQEYAKRIRENARVLAQHLMARDIKLFSGGTDNHLMLVDLIPLGLTGAQAQKALDRAGITLNKNAIPNDPQPPVKTSGVRLGTPAVTTRGMGPDEMARIADWIVQVLHNIDDTALQGRIAAEVREMCTAFPVPGHEGYAVSVVGVDAG